MNFPEVNSLKSMIRSSFTPKKSKKHGIHSKVAILPAKSSSVRLRKSEPCTPCPSTPRLVLLFELYKYYKNEYLRRDDSSS